MNLRYKLFQKKKDSYRVHHKDEYASENLFNYLDLLVPSRPRPIIIVCIGTDRSTGDALGPLIGSQLRKKRPNAHIYGTLESPVHAVNLRETLTNIQTHYSHPFMIGIDACLGKSASIGTVIAGEGPVKPGAGVNKQLPLVGDIHITGIVNVGGFMEYFVLQNTRLHLVISMADFIANTLSQFLIQKDSQLNRPEVIPQK